MKEKAKEKEAIEKVMIRGLESCNQEGHITSGRTAENAEKLFGYIQK